MVQVSEPHRRPQGSGDLGEQIDQVIAMVEQEIIAAKQMSRVQVTDMLLSILEPLCDLRKEIKSHDL